MQSQIHPVPALVDEVRFLCLRLKGFRPRPFHSQVYVPSYVMHAPHRSHTAYERIRLHPVRVEDHIAGIETKSRRCGH